MCLGNRSLGLRVYLPYLSYHFDLTLSPLAQNNRTHRIQTPLTYLQSPHHPTSISALPRLCSVCSQHSLFVSRCPCATITSCSLRITDRSFRYASSRLWNQLPSPYFSPSTSSRSLCPCSCSYHLFSLCQLTALTIHNSLTLSLPAQNLPLPQIFSTIYFLRLQDWLHWHYDWILSYEHLGAFVFFKKFSSLLFLFLFIYLLLKIVHKVKFCAADYAGCSSAFGYT